MKKLFFIIFVLFRCALELNAMMPVKSVKKPEYPGVPKKTVDAYRSAPFRLDNEPRDSALKPHAKKRREDQSLPEKTIRAYQSHRPDNKPNPAPKKLGDDDEENKRETRRNLKAQSESAETKKALIENMLIDQLVECYTKNLHTDEMVEIMVEILNAHLKYCVEHENFFKRAYERMPSKYKVEFATNVLETCLYFDIQGPTAALALQYGANPNGSYWDNSIPFLMRAMEFIDNKGLRDEKLVGLLLDYHADTWFNHPEKNDKINALHLAARIGTVSLVPLLLKKGFSFKDKSLKNGSTPLHEAAACNNVRFLESFACKKIINICDIHGRTPLHYAALHGAHGAFKILCKAGAKTDIRDNGNKTALQYTREYRAKKDKNSGDQKEADVTGVGDELAHLSLDRATIDDELLEEI